MVPAALGAPDAAGRDVRARIVRHTVFLLDSAGTLNAGHAIGGWWPALIVAAGPLRWLHVDALTVFGGAAIKHEK
jgi:hypothetical protein